MTHPMYIPQNEYEHTPLDQIHPPWEDMSEDEVKVYYNVYQKYYIPNRLKIGDWHLGHSSKEEIAYWTKYELERHESKAYADESNSECWERLLRYIVRSAAWDYAHTYYEYMINGDSHYYGNYKSLRKFFLSKWGQDLSYGNGQFILDHTEACVDKFVKMAKKLVRKRIAKGRKTEADALGKCPVCKGLVYGYEGDYSHAGHRQKLFIQDRGFTYRCERCGMQVYYSYRKLGIKENGK